MEIRQLSSTIKKAIALLNNYGYGNVLTQLRVSLSSLQTLLKQPQTPQIAAQVAAARKQVEKRKNS
jgi:hypothetical protein